MKFPVYFKLIDPSNEPRQKGLLTGITSYPPFSYLPPLSPKPQYYAMQITSQICNGTILEINHNTSQLDILGSKQDEIIRFGISNRYEATTAISLPIDEGTSVVIYNVTNTGLKLKEETISTGMVTLLIPQWSLYYIETNTKPTDPQSDLYCEGSLSWNNIKPGSVINGSFIIENRGDNGTILNWEITDYPSWGTWNFSSGQKGRLTPEQENIIVNVTVMTPNEKNREYDDYLILTNADDPKDFERIPIILSTPKSNKITLIDYFLSMLSEKIQLILRSLFVGNYFLN